MGLASSAARAKLLELQERARQASEQSKQTEERALEKVLRPNQAHTATPPPSSNLAPAETALAPPISPVTALPSAAAQPSPVPESGAASTPAHQTGQQP